MKYLVWIYAVGTFLYTPVNAQYALGDGHALDANLSVRGPRNFPVDSFADYPQTYIINDHFGGLGFDHRHRFQNFGLGAYYGEKNLGRALRYDAMGASGWNLLPKHPPHDQPFALYRSTQPKQKLDHSHSPSLTPAQAEKKLEDFAGLYEGYLTFFSLDADSQLSEKIGSLSLTQSFELLNKYRKRYETKLSDEQLEELDLLLIETLETRDFQ